MSRKSTSMPEMRVETVQTVYKPIGIAVQESGIGWRI